MAYRVRRQNRTQPDPERTPKQKDARQPLLHKTLSALADLQAQIVNIGHTLREEEIAEQMHRPTLPTVDHEAEKESLRRQLSEVTEKLQTAQNRIAELDGIVSTQTDQIRQLESEKTQTKTAPATAIQHAIDVVTKELTREEERWLTELGIAIQGGYDPQNDRLVDCKLYEIGAEQDLADVFEQRGQVPLFRLPHRGTLLFPMAIWAARVARQRHESERLGGLLLRSSSGFGKRLPLSDEEFLCKLSNAQKREWERKRSGLERR